MKKTLSLTHLKDEIHQIAAAKLEHAIQDLEKRIQDKKDDELVINQGQLEYDRQSHNSEDKNLVMLLDEQLKKANKQLQVLQRCQRGYSDDVVGPCSMVVARNRVFYVSTSVEEFEYEGFRVDCISTNAPIYEQLKGKKVGDRVEFRQESLLIDGVA